MTPDLADTGCRGWIWSLSNAPPCAKCGGDVELVTYDGEMGTVRCRACGHTFKVKAKPPKKPRPEDD